MLLHSRYLSGSASGENRVVEDELRLLREAGHEVDVWQPSVGTETSGPRLATDAVWSRTATREVKRLVRRRRPDLVHVHSLFPRLSPAVLRAIPHDIPIVMTLHNFRLMCLPATYLRGGSICEDCAGRMPWRGIRHACYRGSRAASAALAVSLTVHRRLDTFSRVSRFLAVSRFVRDKHVEAGLDPNRIVVKANFAWPTDRRRGPGGPLLFLGRISPEKGLDTVLRALPPTLELVVAGDGSQRASLEQQSRPGVKFLGEVRADDVPGLLRSARALLVPSRWYEGQPRAIVEAFASGVPVLASRIGGLPELVGDGINGRLVDPDDVAAWRIALDSVADDEESLRLGHEAFATWERRFTPDVAIEELENVYRDVLAGAQEGNGAGVREQLGRSPAP